MSSRPQAGRVRSATGEGAPPVSPFGTHLPTSPICIGCPPHPLQRDGCEARQPHTCEAESGAPRCKRQLKLRPSTTELGHPPKPAGPPKPPAARAGQRGGRRPARRCSSHRITPSLAGSQPTPIVRRVTNMPISLCSLIGTSAVHFRTESIPVPTLRSRWREHKQWVKGRESQNDMRQRKSEWHETRKPK